MGREVTSTAPGRPDPAAFGGLLRAHRRAAGLTQEALAERAGLSARGIQHLEAGDTRPYAATLEALAVALDLAPAERARLQAAGTAAPAPAHPDDPADGPGALRRLGAGAGQANLPLQLTSFVGRERELAEVARLLGSSRLLTLTGPGGVGKTRLARQAAAAAGPAYPDGVWLVELGALADPALVAPAVATAVGVREVPGRPPGDTLAAALRPRRLLLVLDNCEHLLDGVVPLATGLLGACPGLRVLATSRAALRVSGEQECPVPPLALPDPARPPDPAAVSQAEAVALFVQRAASVAPAFRLTAHNAAAVAAICARLDGLPLALELAAARVKLLPPEALLARLGSRLTVLTGGPRDLPARQQTLRATIAWSYDLLAPAEQTLFARLGAFAGGCTVEAAEAVGGAAGAPPGDVLDGLASLADRSLLQRQEAPPDEEPVPGGPRLVLLETVREYALERLTASGEEAEVRRRHAAFYLALAEASHAELEGLLDKAWLERLEREHDNLRAALDWSERGDGAPSGVPGAREMGPRLAGALWWFWWQRGHLTEGRRWLERMLRLPAGPAVRATALYGAGVLAFHQGDFERSAGYVEESLTLARETGEGRRAGWALHRLRLLAQIAGDYERAEALGAESVAVWRRLGASGAPGLAIALLASGSVAQLQGDAARAAALAGEAAALLRDLGDRAAGLAQALRVLGSAASDLGDGAGARARLDEALALVRELGDRWGVVTVLRDVMVVEQRDGDTVAVAALGQECLRLLRDQGSRSGLDDCYERLAWVASARGDPLRAARLLGAAEAVRAATGARLAPVRRADHEGVVVAVRAALGAAALAAARAEGQAMAPEQALAYALEAAPAPA